MHPDDSDPHGVRRGYEQAGIDALAAALRQNGPINPNPARPCPSHRDTTADRPGYGTSLAGYPPI